MITTRLPLAEHGYHKPTLGRSKSLQNLGPCFLGEKNLEQRSQKIGASKNPGALKLKQGVFLKVLP